MPIKYFIELRKNKEEDGKFAKKEIKTISEAKSELAKEETAFKGLDYTKHIHICRHGENGNNQPCSLVDAKELDKVKKLEDLDKVYEIYRTADYKQTAIRRPCFICGRTKLKAGRNESG